MLSRPDAIGLEVAVKSQDDADAALHEMAYLTFLQRRIEDESRLKIERIKEETDARLKVEISNTPVTIAERWKVLSEKLHAWCVNHLKKHLPPNKKSLKLAHGELKLRCLPATVQMLEGAKPDDVAKAIAADAGLVEKLDKLLDGSIDGLPIRDLITVSFSLRKDSIKERWEKSDAAKAALQKRLITVADGLDQITLVPIELQVT